MRGARTGGQRADRSGAVRDGVHGAHDHQVSAFEVELLACVVLEGVGETIASTHKKVRRSPGETKVQMLAAFSSLPSLMSLPTISSSRLSSMPSSPISLEPSLGRHQQM